MSAKYRWTLLFLGLVLVLPATVLAETTQALQCIMAPDRGTPCPNLLYTSVKMEKGTKIICFCKSDKQPLYDLMNDTTSAKSRVALRKLLNQHQLTSQQLFDIGEH